MRSTAVIALVVASATVFYSVNAANASGTWKCSAKNLVNASYDGGGSAYIHLAPYGRGNNYPVTKRGRNKVVGKTSNGTPFVCRRVR
jgi:hypothetical protein